jgi:hypothetical protein
MTTIIRAAAAAAALCLTAGAASAECRAPAAADELSTAQAAALYDCLQGDMMAGYAKGPKRWIPAGHVADYRGWTQASTAPAAPGPHGDRFLMTWVNAVGSDAYLEFAEENVSIPAGTVIAKESFDVKADGKAVPGPLFLMEKVAAGRSPQTNDWFYMMVSAGGSPVAVNVVAACHECHENYADQGNLGYPDEDVRATR